MDDMYGVLSAGTYNSALHFPDLLVHMLLVITKLPAKEPFAQISYPTKISHGTREWLYILAVYLLHIIQREVV